MRCNKIAFLSTLAFAALCMPAAALARESITMPSGHTLSPNGQDVVFIWGEDIWKAPAAGGAAIPLTTSPEPEFNPEFSPDGREIAFLRTKDGTSNAYVMLASGGTARQLTRHSQGATDVRWISADGSELAIRAPREFGGYDGQRIYSIPRNGKDGERLLIGDEVDAYAMSPDGTRMLFSTYGTPVHRKHYRGAQASQVWIWNKADDSTKRIIAEAASALEPSWLPDGKRFYYLSDKGSVRNIRIHDLETGADEAVTDFKTEDVSHYSASRDGSTLLFRVGLDTCIFRPGKDAAPIKVSYWHDSDSGTKGSERIVAKTVFNLDTWGDCSFTDDGLEICFNSNGMLYVMDTVLRTPVPILADSGIRVTEPRFIDNGNAILFIRDNGLGADICRARRADPDKYWWQNRRFIIEPLVEGESARRQLRVSADGRRMAFERNGNEVWTCDANGKDLRKVWSGPHDTEFEWSPDGFWLALSSSDSWDNTDIWIVSATNERPPVNVSRHPDWETLPRWSPDGKVLAWRAYHRRSQREQVQYVWLSKADEDKTSEELMLEKAIDKMRETRDKKDKTASKPEISNGRNPIDLDNIYARVRTLDANTSGIEDIFWQEKSAKLGIQCTFNGTKGIWGVTFPDKLDPELVNKEWPVHVRWLADGRMQALSNLGVPALLGTTTYPFAVDQDVTPRSRNRLAFRMIWRSLRDRFYDPNMKGVDWPAMLAKYEPTATATTTRGDFIRIVYMLFSELNASHMGFTPLSHGGTRPEGLDVTWHLGVFFDPKHTAEGLKVLRVLRNGPSDKGPRGLQDGDVIVAIDGRRVPASANYTDFLNMPRARMLTLVVRAPNGTEREVLVTPVSYEAIADIRRQDDALRRREIVEKASDRRFGYLNIEEMNWQSFDRFEREMFAEGFDKDGMIIDVRNNPGGFISDNLLAILSRPLHAYTRPRNGELSYPRGYLVYSSYEKPIVVLCNQNSSSNAEIFSHAIKTTKRGKLVGVPTANAVISTPRTRILDYGMLAVPDRGWWNGDTLKDMELQGAQPDFVVWPHMGDWWTGRDAQLEKAIAVLKAEVDALPKEPPALKYAPLEPNGDQAGIQSQSAPAPLAPPAAANRAQPQDR